MENGMTAETEALYQNVIIKYRQQLDEKNWELTRATAQNEAKDVMIAELRSVVSELKELIPEDAEQPDAE